MPYEQEHYEAWIRDYLKPHHPELVPCMMQALEAFTQALNSRTLTSIQLQRLVDCARAPQLIVSENAAALLRELGNHFPVAQEAVRDMVVDPKAHVRLNALVALSCAWRKQPPAGESRRVQPDTYRQEGNRDFPAIAARRAKEGRARGGVR